MDRRLTMPELVPELVADEPERVALTVDGEHALTLREWATRAGAVARSMIDRGVRPGDRVALRFDPADWLGYAVGALGVHLAGGTVVGLPSDLPGEELARRLAQCGVAVTIEGDRVGASAAAGPVVPMGELTVGVAEPPEIPVELDNLAEIIYTSGTTGAAKPVAVTHANLTHGQGGERSRMFADAEAILAAVPLGTNAGHSALMLALTAPTTVHVLSSVEPEAVARMIAKLRVPLAIVPAPLAVRMVAHRLPERHDLSSITAFMLGSAHVPMPTRVRLAEAVPGASLLVGYGSTEAAPAFCFLAVEPAANNPDPARWQQPQLASVGSPRGGTEVMITGADGAAVAAGQVGEVWLRSPAPPRSYYRTPDATAATFQGGWTRMGDLGHVDRAGNLHIFDRVGDAIPHDGGTISSLRVADALLWHPAVLQAAAFGGSGRSDGAAVDAAVELGSPVPPDELRSFAAAHLAPVEVPGRVVVVDALPCGSLGKVRKRALRQQGAPGK